MLYLPACFPGHLTLNNPLRPLFSVPRPRGTKTSPAILTLRSAFTCLYFSAISLSHPPRGPLAAVFRDREGVGLCGRPWACSRVRVWAALICSSHYVYELASILLPDPPSITARCRRAIRLSRLHLASVYDVPLNFMF